MGKIQKLVEGLALMHKEIERIQAELSQTEKLRKLGATQEWADDIAMTAAQLGVRDSDHLYELVRTAYQIGTRQP